MNSFTVGNVFISSANENGLQQKGAYFNPFPWQQYWLSTRHRSTPWFHQLLEKNVSLLLSLIITSFIHEQKNVLETTNVQSLPNLLWIADNKILLLRLILQIFKTFHTQKKTVSVLLVSEINEREKHHYGSFHYLYFSNAIRKKTRHWKNTKQMFIKKYLVETKKN